MTDAECVAFLQWSLPVLGLRWEGFRRVRAQVCKRIRRRIDTLGLKGPDGYRLHLEEHPEEWQRLDSLCRITISRFHRDSGVVESLGTTVLPALAERVLERGDAELVCWSAGCASGEEPYTLRILWDLELAGRYPAMGLRVLATDADGVMIERATTGRFAHSSVKDLPSRWREEAFERGEVGDYLVRDPFREGIEFRVQDLRDEMPAHRFDLVLCRNLVFTYFGEDLQRGFLDRLATRMVGGGALVVGGHEALPADTEGFSPWEGARSIFRFEPRG